MITTIVVVFIIAVVSNLIMGFMDIAMKRDAMAMLEYITYEDGQPGQPGELPVKPQVIALNDEQIQAIARLVIQIMSQKNTKE